MDQQATRQGFFYGYLIVGTSSSIQMMFLSCMFAYGVLFKELESEFGCSRFLPLFPTRGLPGNNWREPLFMG
jgi:hypothetical protein